MRIVIDMQGAQSTGSRNRGIGRYTLSLVKAIVQERDEHEIVLALNGQFADTIEPIRTAFDGLLPQENIRVWHALAPTAHVDPSNTQRRQAAELVYEAFLASLAPDFIYVTSLFEGLGDGAITSIHRQQAGIPVAVTLYDLIPYINPVPYLENPGVKSWYLDKIEHLRRADLWLAISESSRQEGIAHLGFSEERSINVSTDADADFRSIDITAVQEQALRRQYGLDKPFVMYTGGIDYRKNIEGLIRAYARLPEEVRKAHQLAIVCSVQPPSREALEQLARQHGLTAHEIVLTGFVPDADLLALYNLCKLFVFPSWHEGFGLPALEAMRCGAPVIGANTSSLPEVIGWQEALFDPHSDEAIADAMHRGLTDAGYRNALVRHGREQAGKFSWLAGARRAIDAMEQYLQRKHAKTPAPLAATPRQKLAYVSPLPPARSGIADYSAELLPELSKYYDIDVIVQQDEDVADPWILAHCPIRSPQWLLEHADTYDRVLYHFGNSAFHQHMFDLLERVPGVVMLHDFFLSGIQAHRDITCAAPQAWVDALYASHGYMAVLARYTAADIADVIWKYPANLPVLQRALGIIVHGESSRTLARRWYGERAGSNWHVIPLLRVPTPQDDRAAIRREFGLDEDAVLVCSFGLLGPTKLNHRLLDAWLASSLAANDKAYLVFVGENHNGDYGQSLLNTIAASNAKQRIRITGWADMKTFRNYLVAADMAVQLRTLSRGETSGTVLDCMNHGVATIVNAHGSMADLDPDGVWMLPDEFCDADLVAALTDLAQNPARRHELGARAVEIVRTRHAPAACGRAYHEAIEGTYQTTQDQLPGLLARVAGIGLPENEHAPMATCLARNFPPQPRLRQLLVDISGLIHPQGQDADSRPDTQILHAILKTWIDQPPQGFQVKPVYADSRILGYRYARQYMLQRLGVPDDWSKDEPVEAWSGDVFIGLDSPAVFAPEQQAYLQGWHDDGVRIWFFINDLSPVLTPENFPPHVYEAFQRWMDGMSQFDGVVCVSRAVADDVRSWLSLHGSQRERPLVVEHVKTEKDGAPGVPIPPNEAMQIARQLLEAVGALKSNA